MSSSNYDIIMSLDDTLELDLIIDKWGSPNNIINATHSKDYTLTGIQTKTGIYDPEEPGIHTIDVNGQELKIKVRDPNKVPDSVIFDFESGDLSNFDTKSGLQISNTSLNGSHSGYSGTNNQTVATATVYDSSGLQPTEVEYYYKNDSNGAGVGFYDSNGDLVFGSGTRWPQQDYVYSLNSSGNFSTSTSGRKEITVNGGGWVKHNFVIDWNSGTVDIEFVHNLNGSSVTNTDTGLQMNSTVDIREFRMHTYDDRGQDVYFDDISFFA